MQAEDITVEVRDKSLTRLGVIRPEDLYLTAAPLFNNVGQWTLSLSSDHPLADALMAPGAGIIVTGPNDVLFSGPTTEPTTTATSDAPQGMLTIVGITDDIVLADYLAFPDPTNIDPTTQTLAHDVRTGDAESVMYAFVNANCGPGAPSARRKANLIMGSNGHRGSTVTVSARFDVLGDLLNSTATQDNLGYRVVQCGSKLVFEVYTVSDRSSTVRLDIWNNGLASRSLAVTAPTATQVIVAGQGDLTDRQFYAATNPTALAAEAAWGRRIERFVDQRQTDDTNEFVQKAAEILAAEGLTGIAAKAVPMDDTTMLFGVDYNLGDTIATVAEDTEYSSTVTGYVMSASPDGFKLGIALGDLARLDPSAAVIAKLNDAARRVDNLERNAETSNGGLMAKVSTTGPSDSTATGFSTATAISTTGSLTIRAGRNYRVRAVVSSVAVSFTSGSGRGFAQISRSGNALGSRCTTFSPTTGTSVMGVLCEYVGQIPAGTFAFGVKFWCDTGSTKVSAGNNTEAITVTVEDLGPVP